MLTLAVMVPRLRRCSEPRTDSRPTSSFGSTSGPPSTPHASQCRSRAPDDGPSALPHSVNPRRSTCAEPPHAPERCGAHHPPVHPSCGCAGASSGSSAGSFGWAAGLNGASKPSHGRAEATCGCAAGGYRAAAPSCGCFGAICGTSRGSSQPLAGAYRVPSPEG